MSDNATNVVELPKYIYLYILLVIIAPRIRPLHGLRVHSKVFRQPGFRPASSRSLAGSDV